VARRGPVLVRSDYETKRSEAKRRGVAPTKTTAHRDVTCAPRGGDARALSLQLRRSRTCPSRLPWNTACNKCTADRWDVNQKSKAINWRGRARTLSGRKRETRIFLAGEEEATSCFSRRARGDPDPESAVCLECVCTRFLFFLVLFLVCFFVFFFFCEAPRDRKHTIWNAAGCTAKRALITMTRSKKAAAGY